MIILIVLTSLIFSLLLFGYIEYMQHRRNLQKIPVRIHVNGTRGKSSVVRLIAAGLRASGKRVVAKTTGTFPRVITSDGREYPVYRPAKANILEQIRIIGFAARHKTDMLVIECMALQPHLQALCELNLVKSTHGVITNARPDHLDVMGPNEKDVAYALLGTTPLKGTLYSCEKDYVNEFKAACQDRQSRLDLVSNEELKQVTKDELAGFSYVEHRENVALALKVCEHLGVNRVQALAEMWKAEPDAGAMREYQLEFFNRSIRFVNGFAANDPESSRMIWHMMLEKNQPYERKIMVINTRMDRPDRSKQLGEALATWQHADHYYFIGSGTYILAKTVVKHGIDYNSFSIGEGLTGEQIFEDLMGLAGRSALIMGLGNIAGVAHDLIALFKNRAQLK